MAMQQLIFEESGSGDVSMVAMFNHMQLMHAVLIEFKNSKAMFQASLSLDGVNNMIIVLRQEIAELNVTTNNLATISSTCHKCDISKTDYQDHHQSKTEDQDPKSFLGSFLDSCDLESFLRSFLVAVVVT